MVWFAPIGYTKELKTSANTSKTFEGWLKNLEKPYTWQMSLFNTNLFL